MNLFAIPMTRIKICGITNLDDALVVAKLGADLLGFIFYEPSPRFVQPESVKEIIEVLRANTHHAIMVGVFVNEAPDTVRQIIDFCQLDVVQLHGEESPDFVHSFQRQAYKAIRPKSKDEADMLISKYSCGPESVVSTEVGSTKICYLIDAYHPTLYGGTGHVADWSMATKIARQYPILLAGSLTQDNVAEAIRQVQPWGVDVSSGVESSKGKKDYNKVKNFIQQVRNED
jgi:phosphoribosylanthranilate isomerase